MMRFRMLLMSVALLLAAAPVSAQTTAAPRDKVVVAFPPVDPTAEVLYAYDLGYFDKAGIDVTLQPLGNGGAITSGVAGGSIDIGVGNVITIESAHKKGVPIVVIAPGAVNLNSAASNVLIISKTSTIKSAKDLNGKIIATTPLRGIGEVLTDVWLDKNGGDASTIKYIEVPFPDAAAIVSSGRAEASLSVEPFLTMSRGDTRVFANIFDALGDGYLITGYFANSTWAQAHPGLVARFAKAIRDAGAWANANPDKSAEILAKYGKLDVAIVKQTTRARYATTLTPQQIQSTIDASAKYKILDGGFPASELIYQAPK